MPGGPWVDGKPPWKIEATRLALDFGEASNAADYLEKLFRLAFGIQDGLIYLRGQYDLEPTLPVRAELQAGVTLTFLQHGRVRSLDKSATQYSYDPEGSGQRTITLEYKKCHGFKHQDGWKDLVDRRGCLRLDPVEVIGPLNPGAVVRHVAFIKPTSIVATPDLVVPLYFAIVGCLALPINRGVGVLIVPDVEDLERFADDRPAMTPTTARECRITSAGDAALQAQIRLKAKREMKASDLPGCHTVTFQPLPWASQQKSRSRVMNVLPGREISLDQFEVAMDELSPRIAPRKNKMVSGKGKDKRTVETTEFFWSDSVIRPLVADNIASGRRWYAGFAELMRKLDPVNGRPLRNRIIFEKKGLHSMVEKEMFWQDTGENAFIRSVHEAMRRRYGAIAGENSTNPVAMKNRMTREYERLRLAFAGAKTSDQFRNALCDLFARAGLNPVLQKDWQVLLPMLNDQRWQLARDLSLLALASYTGKGASAIEEAAVDAENPEEGANVES